VLLIGLRASLRARGRAMLIYLFRDESDNDVFAFSIDVTGSNIPPLRHIPNGFSLKPSTP
jgi:hypothetical protein